MNELKTAILASKRAAKIADEYLGVESTLKGDGSPVTVADTMCEEAIRNTILEEFPEHSILGEEKGKTGESEYTWIIDPIDGTLFYTRGMRYFSILISLMHKDELVLGVSNAPKLDEFLYAKKGEGAYFNNKKIRVSKISELEKSVFFHGNLAAFSRAKQVKNLEHLNLKVWRSRGYGNLLGGHNVASGKIEAFIGPKLKIWDVAALAVIVEEAGGVATDMAGKKLSFETTSILLSNGLIHNNLISAFNK